MFDVNDRVQVKSTGETGTVSFIGALDGKPGIFVGVTLDRNTGRNDGSFESKRYFQCRKNHGVFVRQENLRKEPPKEEEMYGKFSAARSHELNEAYMEEFHEGFNQLRLQANGGKESKEDSRNWFDQGEQHGESVAANEPGIFDGREFQGKYEPNFPHSKGDLDWSRGPIDPEGILFDASNEPLLCSALSPDGREVVVGGCDHGLRVYDVKTGKEKRNLYTKRSGHTEWVTDCTYAPNGSILSCGMDGKICIWRGTQADEIEAHVGSTVARFMVTQSGDHFITCSYDKTIKIWNLRRRMEMACFKGHRAPVMEIALSNGVLLSGSRDGVGLAWDINTGTPRRLNEGQHQGMVTCMKAVGDTQFVSGDQKGTVRFWDLRSRGAAASMACLHPGGALNSIETTFDGMLVSAGADKRILMVDPRRMDEPIFQLCHHKDFIYSLKVTHQHILSGGGDGMLLVHKLDTGRLCFGLGANKHGVRCIEYADNFVVAAGDDGNGIIYNFT